MFGIILVLLVGAGVYVGWFHKFTLEDGSEAKGWIAKYKAEHNASPMDNPKEALDDIVATARRNKNVEAAVQKAKDLAGKNEVNKVESGELKAESGELKAESGELKAESKPAAGITIEEAPNEGIAANGSSRVPTEDNPSGLSITSMPLDFEEVLQEAQADPFDKAWGLMEGYFGWLLLGASRNDWIDRDSVWITMSNACEYFKAGLEVDYKEMIERGESDEEELRVMPAWMVNAHLLNGIGFFGERAKQYFSGEEYERIKEWIKAVAQDRTARAGGPDTKITDEPNAAFWLSRLFTIFRGEDDFNADYNMVEYFEVRSAFDIHLPEPKMKEGICEN